MAFDDLRAALDWLAATGGLTVIEEPVSPHHEIGAFLALACARETQAYRFAAVIGHRTQVVANVVQSREILAAAMDVPPADLIAAYRSRLATPLDPRVLPDGPVLEQGGEEVDLPALLPALTHYERDSGPFITSGMVSMRNPVTGSVERTLCRMQLRGRDGLGLGFLNPPFSTFLPQFAEQVAAGSPPDVAITMGFEPLVLLGAALPPGAKSDKLAVVGGLRGAPVDVVSARRSGIPVPARAEYLLEGVLEMPGAFDGPMGESSGYYQGTHETPTCRVRSVAHRAEPIYQALLPTGPDADVLMGLVIEAALAPAIHERFPFVRRMAFSPGSFGASVVVSVAPTSPAEVRELVRHLLTAQRTKKAVVVADDVDPADLPRVEWSIVTRSQPDKDVVLVSGVRGHPIDPTCLPDGISSRIGIDATGFDHHQCEGPVTFSTSARTRAQAIFDRTRKGRQT